MKQTKVLSFFYIKHSKII